MRLLALDTSTTTLALALSYGDLRWCEELPGGPQASAALLPQLQRMLAQAGLRWADLDAIAFGRGPGAFTGLRTACAVAQGLALAVGCPVLPIDSLLIEAEAARDALGAEDVDVAMDARMGELYAARYSFDHAQWRTVQPPGLYSPAALRAHWLAHPPRCVAGDGLSLVWPADEQGSAAAAPVGLRAPAPGPGHRAEALWRCAAMAQAAGQGVDAALALPLYVRDKVAQTSVERAQARAARSDEGAGA